MELTYNIDSIDGSFFLCSGCRVRVVGHPALKVDLCEDIIRSSRGWRESDICADVTCTARLIAGSTVQVVQ